MLIVHLTEQIILTINQLYVHQRNTVTDKSNILKNCNFLKKKNTTCIKTRVNNLQSCDCHFVYQLLEK